VPSGARELELDSTTPVDNAPSVVDPFWFCGTPSGDQDVTVQRSLALSAASGENAAPGAVERAADHGTRGAPQALPHLDTIQASFGRHDVTHVKAHADDGAREAGAALGAKAFATGDHVSFASSPDLFTAAHEAAHVVQQQGGIALKSGLDDGAGDPHEQHADAVASAVVSGRSAEPLLDQVAQTGGARGGAAPGAAVQRMRMDANGNYVALLGAHRDTADRAQFAAWVEELRVANNVEVLTRLRDSLHRDLFTLADHEAIARSLVQRALDRLAAPAPAPAANAPLALGNLPRDEWWKLFIEGNQHQANQTDEQNAMRFDNDQSPGYYAAMSQSFQREVLDSDGHHLDFDDYDRMHRGVTGDTLRQRNAGGFEAVPHRLSARDVQYPMTQGEYPSPMALREMQQDQTLGLNPALQAVVGPPIAQLDDGHRAMIDNLDDGIQQQRAAGPVPTTGNNAARLNLTLGRVYQEQPHPEDFSSMLHLARVGPAGPNQFSQLLVRTNREPGQARDAVNELFATYYEALAEIDGGHQPAAIRRQRKLQSIARLVRALHVGHYFHDANGRLNTMVLLDRLLVDAGFSPVIMDKTDIFGGNSSVDELVAAIRTGLNAFALAVGLAHIDDVIAPAAPAAAPANNANAAAPAAAVAPAANNAP
jgi:hypothetical protein